MSDVWSINGVKLCRCGLLSSAPASQGPGLCSASQAPALSVWLAWLFGAPCGRRPLGESPPAPLTDAAPPGGRGTEQRAVNLLQPLQVCQPAGAVLASHLLYGSHDGVEIVLQDASGAGLRGGTAQPESKLGRATNSPAPRSWAPTSSPWVPAGLWLLPPVACRWVVRFLSVYFDGRSRGRT